MRIRYTVRAAEPAEHRGDFTIDLNDVEHPSVDLVLPSWVPGSYRIADRVRTFRHLSARPSPEGPNLPVERVEKNRWRIATQGAKNVHVAYSVYGHELSDEGFDLSDEHLFVNAALCLPYVDGHLADPVEVSLGIPSDWQVVTELEPVGNGAPSYRAPNYDVLVDNPIDAGHPLVVTVRPSGIPHRISICGQGGNYEIHRLEEDLGKIVDATIRLIGDSPLRSYTFFYHLAEVPDGGLEHASSTSCVIRRTAFHPLTDYQRFLSLSCHEYFHLYNVKRIRPKVLGPFDYTRENYTRLLWWMEGTTDYFTDLVLRRAGLLTPERFLQEKAKEIQQYLETPGRRQQNLEDSSWLAWVDHYQPFEESPNQSISYYLKGNLVSLCLDLEVRHRTENRASLETVLRTLWTEYGKLDRGLEEGELLTVASRSTGLDLGPFFERYVRGTEEIDFGHFAELAGLTFGPKPKRKDEEEDPSEPGYLGIRYENSGGLVRVKHVLVETPGRQAGLTPGDEIVAINNVKVTFEGFDKVLKRYPPATPVDLTLFRRGYLRRLPLTMGKPPPEAYAFSPSESSTELAKSVYESWVGAKWERPPKSESPRPSSEPDH